MPNAPEKGKGVRDPVSRLDDPGFTPARADVPKLLLALEDEDHAAAALRALARVGVPAARAAVAALATGHGGAGHVALVGRVAAEHPEPDLVASLVEALGHDEPRRRKAAIVALGKFRAPGTEAALVERFGKATGIDRRAIVVSLGKAGGARAIELVEAIDAQGDESLARNAQRAKLLLARTVARAASAVVLDRRLPKAVPVVFRCRAGLERIVADEVGALAVAIPRVREVASFWGGTLRGALAVRTATDVCLERELDEGEDPARALVTPSVVAALRAWAPAPGPVRVRTSFASGGKRRAEQWDFAARLSKLGKDVVSDPTRAPWEVEVQPGRLLLRPKGFVDPRFSYRVRDVPAASHPTIAAALAHVGGVRDNDVVWDPFCGSGLELVERARLGPYRAIYGTDVDPAALEAARANLGAAEVRAVLVCADARSWRPAERPTLVLTNPPMGRRVVRDRSLPSLLDAVLAHVLRALGAGGRVVWLSPAGLVRGGQNAADRSAAAAARAGLAVRRLGPVDLGGFDADLQTFTAPPG